MAVAVQLPEDEIKPASMVHCYCIIYLGVGTMSCVGAFSVFIFNVVNTTAASLEYIFVATFTCFLHSPFLFVPEKKKVSGCSCYSRDALHLNSA